MGYYPPNPSHNRLYDAAYFAEYKRRAATPMGEALTDARVRLVRKFYNGDGLVDIGIGSGQFVEAFDCQGFDINPIAVAWLRNGSRWFDAYVFDCEAITCWDSLEHIDDPGALIESVQRWVFVSLPIFENVDHVVRSKHFKPDEHIWYWTKGGLINWMLAQDFDCVYFDRLETQLGREDIGSFVFQRKP